VDFLESQADGHIVRNLGKYGDWCPPGSIFPKRTPSELTNTWYYYHDTALLARMAEIAGRAEIAGTLRERSDEIRSAFNREFLKNHGYATISMMARDFTPGQTSNVLPLFLDMVPDESRKLVETKLMESIVKHQDMHLDTGIVGTRYIFDVLTSMGQAETAFKIATQKTYPGWGYMFQEGATTLWERWECLTGAGMNSHNHIMLGSVDAWLYKSLAGLECTAPGWRKLRVAPQPVEGLPWASAAVETIRGRASVSWVRSKTTFTLTVVIPSGSTADIVFPAFALTENTEITENGTSVRSELDQGASLSRGTGYYQYEVKK
jgi:alpha-L-rhamnosidase